MAEKEKSTDEKPLKLKARKVQKRKSQKNSGLVCIIHYSRNKSDFKIRPLSHESFKKIKETVDIRQDQETANDRLDDICSQVPETFCPHVHGQHRWCYKNFTNISRLLKRKRSPGDDDDDEPCASKRRRSSETPSTTVLLPSDKCLFCDKNRIKRRGKEETLVKCVTKSSEYSIKRAAEKNQCEEILLKVQNIDLVAREAHYHPSCRKDFTRASDRSHHQQHDEESTVPEERIAHKAAFEYLVQHVKESIIEGFNVERMTMLREKYLQYMLEYHPKHYNAEYRVHKLKSKLVNHFGNDIQFWQPNYKSELVFCSGVPKGQAIESAFEIAASDSKRLEEAALILRRYILSAHNESSEMPWPPSSSFLQSDAVCPPQSLQDFITHLITSKGTTEHSSRKQRLVSSFAQDLCKAVTGGRWEMPKHLLLGMTLRHLTGSAEIVTLINRYGHCGSYTRITELETAMCKSISERNSILPTTIASEENIVTHLCWDNFDLMEETPSGAGTTHTAHGIIIQETSSDNASNVAPASSDIVETSSRRKERSVAYKQPDIDPCFIKGKAEPVLPTSITEVPHTEATANAESSDMMWIYTRAIPKQVQSVPSWSGWVSLTGGYLDNSGQKSTVDYLPPVFAPVTENSTVQHLLKLSQEASGEVGQQYTIVTFDLAVAKKAYAILWEKPEVFKNVLVRMGGFHLTCAYMCAIGKSLRCSGFEEILVESGICASGSIEKVISGKHYNRALRVHKLVLEALERLLLQMFESSQGDSLTGEAKGILSRLAENPCAELISEALANESCMEMLTEIQNFKRRIRQGEFGKTPQFWVNYMDRIWLVLQFQRATKENNFDLHVEILQRMCSLFFSYDHQNYARYTTVYLLSLLNISESHPGAEHLLRQNGFSVSRSDVPFSRNAVDITIEQTINRHAKSHGGIIGFSRNQSAYYRWCITRHARASYRQATMEIVGMDTQEYTSHKDVRSSEIIQSEDDTCKVMQAISNFTNPFEVDDKDALYCLSSGVPAPSDVEHDLLQADNLGKEAHSAFIQERLVESNKSYHDPIKKLKLKTFASLAKSAKLTAKSKKTKEVIAERNVLGQLVLLALEHQISMERVLSFPLGPVPWALATADGVPVKTDKAKLMHILEEDAIVTQRPLQHTSYIIDGNAMLQALVSLPTTFGELAESVFGQIPKVPRVDFVTDSYLPLSIKEIERHRRGSAKTHLIQGALTKVPRDWKNFMSSNENKQRLINFLLSEWKKDKFAPKLRGRKLLFVCRDKCMSLESPDGEKTILAEVEELSSTQEEADTKIVLHCLNIASHSPDNSSIIIRSPDTDVFILLLHFIQNLPQNILFDTGVGNKRRLIDVHKVVRNVGQQICHALPALHAFSGCDTTSAFVRKGKLLALKTLRENEVFLETFLALGRSAEVPDTTMNQLERFVCRLYSKASVTNDVNTMRYEKFLERYYPKPGMVLSNYNGIDMSLLPPCKSSLKMHTMRANYQALIWYNADKADADIPQPNGYGWDVLDGKLEFKWTEGDLMPQDLIDILVDEDDNTEEDDGGDDELVNLSDVIFNEEMD